MDLMGIVVPEHVSGRLVFNVLSHWVFKLGARLRAQMAHSSFPH